jgi:hypothetical protein
VAVASPIGTVTFATAVVEFATCQGARIDTHVIVVRATHLACTLAYVMLLKSAHISYLVPIALEREFGELRLCSKRNPSVHKKP